MIEQNWILSIHNILDKELAGVITPREAIGAIQKLTDWEPSDPSKTIVLEGSTGVLRDEKPDDES